MADYLGPSDFFEGVIRALGLTIPAASGVVAPENESQIQWVRESDGKLVASIFGWDELVLDGGGNIIGDTRGLELGSVNDFAGGETEFEIKADSNGAITSLHLASDSTTSTGEIHAQAASGRESRTVLDETGRSDWLTTRTKPLFGADGGELGLRMLRGDVDGTGAITHGEGFTCTKTGTGVYRIDFASFFSAPPTVVCTPLPSLVAEGIELGAAPTVDKFTAIVFNMSANPPVANDVGFHFIAIGPI